MASGEWVESMGVISRRWMWMNIWVWLVGVVVRRYIDLLTLLIPTPLVFVLFFAAASYFLFI